MKNWFKKHYEARLLLLAAKILNRNVERSPVINRRDNNYLFEVEFELKAIAKRIKSEYNEI
ncbi:TPA: hypothetical protein ACMDWR_003189 [Vibrio cholerae]|uniref:Uncharacterized protein n=1 Tax=Vibrio splendidus TaxID=29497 RepID=A0A2T5EJC6_VIBSP|nr:MULTISPECIES: hypothetical protein [Vibrio]EHK6026359.1 hypothetical protein [Vibrio parahaemolyticus]EHY9845656.1 hypothetical protein [Vibrio cholerae]EKF9121621.1 hypothetical protein [Vibrio cholerae]MCJ0806689.1 hypothetical protein [Vibrio vulnificus]MCS0096534.1 hypothetical protein [Vibrio cholerae]